MASRSRLARFGIVEDLRQILNKESSEESDDSGTNYEDHVSETSEYSNTENVPEAHPDIAVATEADPDSARSSGLHNTTELLLVEGEEP